MTADRCAAAHPEDPTPCVGPHDAVMILDANNAGADGCEHHGARLLASIEGGRAVSGLHSPGAAIRVHKAADSIRPFPWNTDVPRTRPDQLSREENRATPVFEVEQSGADSDGWDPDDPYGHVAEYEGGGDRG